MKQQPKTIIKYIEQQPQPNDPETEVAVLATMMRFNEEYLNYSDLLSKDLFYTERNQFMFDTISGVINQGSITDLNSLMSYVASNGMKGKVFREDFQKIIQFSSPSTFHQDLDRLRDLSKRREIWKQLQIAAMNIQDYMKSTGETVSGIMEVLSDIQNSENDNGIYSFDDACAELSNIVEGNKEGKTQAVMTGYFIFDGYYLLRPETLTVIAAFTSVGKSALAMNIATAAAEQEIGVGYYSLEMGKAELAARTISDVANLPSSWIMNKKLEGSEYSDFNNAIAKKRSLPIYIDENATSSFDRTVRSIRTLKKTKNVGLVIIDYLQIYAQTGDSEENSLATMAREAKNLAKELKIPIILLSQLNRSAEHPTLKMLRGSGQIEESADNIVLIDRPAAYPNNPVTNYNDREIDGRIGTGDLRMDNTALFILSKGRGVGTGKELVGFDGKYTHFYELNQNFIESSKVKQLPHKETVNNNVPF